MGMAIVNFEVIHEILQQFYMQLYTDCCTDVGFYSILYQNIHTFYNYIAV